MDIEDPYLFILNFEACLSIHMAKVSNDVARMRVIPFALKDDAKRWMCGLNVGFIKSRDWFVDIFLERYFTISKTVRLRSENLHFVQLEHEPFWEYMNRFKELLF